MNDMQNMQSTTEELIVAYLDGELVRKELEIELFDRLATAQEARMLLREHLVMRGAIKQSLTDDRFMLSDDLDTRTRARLETILKNVSTPAIVQAGSSYAAHNKRGTVRLADAPAVSHNAAERRLQQWSRRPAMLALLLLLAVGSTWYLTRASIDATSNQMATNTPADHKTDISSQNNQIPSGSEVVTPSATESGVKTAATSVKPETKVIVRNVVRYIERPSREMAHQNAATQNVQTAASSEQHADPAGIMLSRRAKRALENSNTIVITEQDRI